MRPWDEIEDPGRWLSPKRNEVWKPVVAAVEGMCAGGAAYWISECDIVICERERALFPDITVEEGIRIFLTGGMALPPRLRV